MLKIKLCLFAIVFVFLHLAHGQELIRRDALLNGPAAYELYVFLKDHIKIKARSFDSKNLKEVRLLGMECVRDQSEKRESSVKCFFDKMSDAEELYKVQTILKAYNLRDGHPIFELSHEDVF